MPDQNAMYIPRNNKLAETGFYGAIGPSSYCIINAGGGVHCWIQTKSYSNF